MEIDGWGGGVEVFGVRLGLRWEIPLVQETS